MLAMSTGTVIFWVIFKTSPFPKESTDFNAVWTVIGLGLLALY